MSGSLSPAAYRRLVRLSAKLSRELGFDVVPRRDPATGTFTSGGAITGDALLKAWTLLPRRRQYVGVGRLGRPPAFAPAVTPTSSATSTPTLAFSANGADKQNAPVRASWGLSGQRANNSPAREEFKRQLLANLRAPRE